MSTLSSAARFSENRADKALLLGACVPVGRRETRSGADTSHLCGRSESVEKEVPQGGDILAARSKYTRMQCGGCLVVRVCSGLRPAGWGATWQQCRPDWGVVPQLRASAPRHEQDPWLSSSDQSGGSRAEAGGLAYGERPSGGVGGSGKLCRWKPQDGQLSRCGA